MRDCERRERKRRIWQARTQTESEGKDVKPIRTSQAWHGRQFFLRDHPNARRVMGDPIGEPQRV
jgi:hypothetical protein